MTLRPVPGLDSVNEHRWTRWLVDWVPPTTETLTLQDVYDWLANEYPDRPFTRDAPFRVIAMDLRPVEFGGGPTGRYRHGDGVRLIAEYVARGNRRHDIKRRILKATNGLYQPDYLSIVEVARVNLEHPAMMFPACTDFASMPALARS